MRARVFAFVRLCWRSVLEFRRDGGTALAAALSYYTIFSIPALLVIVTSVAGLAFGRQAVEARILAQIQSLIGPDGAKAIENVITNAGPPTMSRVSTSLVGIVLLLVGATGAFAQLQSSLNRMWQVKPEPDGSLILQYMVKRLLSLGMVLGIGFLLLVSLIVSAALSALGDWLKGFTASDATVPILETFNFFISLGAITVLFAAIYVVLPDARMPWRLAWFGATVTALLFVLGKTLIGLYLGRSDPGSAYGAAGSLAVILVWVYYSSITLFIGAEFTILHARQHGWRTRPEEFAVKTTKTTPPAKVQPGAAQSTH